MVHFSIIIYKFVEDIKDCVASSDNWVIVLNSSASPKTEDKKHQKIRLTVSVAEELEGCKLDDCVTVDNHEKLKEFYDDLCRTMSAEHDIEPGLEFSKGKPSTMRNYIRNRFGQHPNVIQIDIAADYRLFGSDVKARWTSIYTLAKIIHRHFDEGNTEGCVEGWTAKEAKEHRSEMIPCHLDEMAGKC